jgi:hypothetical protein
MASWFSHDKCGGELLIDCSDAVSLMATFGISDKSLRVGLGSLQTRPQKVFKPKFICKICNEEVEPEHIKIVCFHCGEVFTPDQIFKIKGVGGAYCKPDADKLFESFEKIPMSKIIENAEV